MRERERERERGVCVCVCVWACVRARVRCDGCVGMCVYVVCARSVQFVRGDGWCVLGVMGVVCVCVPLRACVTVCEPAAVQKCCKRLLVKSSPPHLLSRGREGWSTCWIYVKYYERVWWWAWAEMVAKHVSDQPVAYVRYVHHSQTADLHIDDEGSPLPSVASLHVPCGRSIVVAPCLEWGLGQAALPSPPHPAASPTAGSHSTDATSCSPAELTIHTLNTPFLLARLLLLLLLLLFCRLIVFLRARSFDAYSSWNQ